MVAATLCSTGCSNSRPHLAQNPPAPPQGAVSANPAAATHAAVPASSQTGSAWQGLIGGSQQALMIGDIAKAQQLCDQAMQLARGFGPQDVRPSRNLMLLAEIYRAGGHLDLAEQSFKDAAARCETAVGPDNPAMIAPLDSLANFYYFVQKRYDLAAPLCERILRIVETATPRNNAEVVKRARAVGTVYRDLKQYATAEPYFRQSLALVETNTSELGANLLKVSDFYREWGHYEQAEALSKRALALAENTARSNANSDAQENLAVSLYGLAEIYRTWGKTDLAEPLYERSVAIVEKKDGIDSSELAHPLTGLAATLRAEGKPGQAEALYKRVLSVTENKLEPDDAAVQAAVGDYAAMLDTLNRSGEADTLRRTQKWKELMFESARSLKSNLTNSEQRCTEALKLAVSFGPTDVRLSRSQVQMAEVYRWQGRKELAEQSYKDAVASCEKAVGPNHPDMIPPLESLANFYYYTKVEYDQVAPLYQWILDIVQGEPSPDNAEVASWSRNLADVYRLETQNAMAEAFYKRALSAAEAATNATEADTVQYLQALSDFYRSWDKCEQAEPLAKRALAIREKAAGPDAGPDAQLDVAVCCDGLGQIYLDWNRPDEAAACYARSLAIAEKIAGSESPDITPRLMGLASALRAQRKFAEAETQYQRALAITEKSTSAAAPELVEILEKYAGLLKDLNKPDQAKVLMARAESIRQQN
jgi:tetratricopeptide (TPR) repeat protein